CATHLMCWRSEFKLYEAGHTYRQAATPHPALCWHRALRLAGKLGEQPRRIRPHVRLGPNTDGIIAIWGKVTLEPLDAAGLSELVAGRSPRKGILVDFIGNPSDSARQGLDVYRVSGGPGFVWSASFNSKGQGTMRFFSVDPWALLPLVSKERT